VDSADLAAEASAAEAPAAVGKNGDRQPAKGKPHY